MLETIFALATPPGRSGVAVIRISGVSAVACAADIGAADLPLRTAVVRRLKHPEDGATIDRALALRFEGPASFTGEDVVELHIHGGPVVVRAISELLALRPGMRRADPGEFTRRALMNGKLDLAQVEGLGDLLAAETAAQAKLAIALMDGAVTDLSAAWRSQLVRALALIEASIDFSDDDIPGEVLDDAGEVLGELLASLDRALVGSGVSERIRLGFEVALVGAPNVGKSTLLNALAGRDAALTSEVAGTTRDVIEVRLDLGGMPVTILDMAGLRATKDPVEVLGVARARRRAALADLRVFLVDRRDDVGGLNLTVQDGDVVALAKADLRVNEDGEGVSGLTGLGVERLIARIGDVLAGRVAMASGISHERQRRAVRQARSAAAAARGCLSRRPPQPELASVEVRAALGALDFLLGKVDVEQVLDEIFASFCLGK